MLILNLGCGTKASPRCVNIDWSVYLVLRKNPIGRLFASRFLSGARLERFNGLPASIVVHDLRKGIPAADGSADVVFHSHMFEHIDRSAVPGFLREVRRVLKPGGIQRVVVPDLEAATRRYLADFDAPARTSHTHDGNVARIIEQMVRRESSGTSHQPPLRRLLENTVLGDARRRGETHQWMWDRLNLSVVLQEAGFVDVRIESYDKSAIPGWNEIGLDLNADGSQYKPDSLYVEARQPL